MGTEHIKEFHIHKEANRDSVTDAEDIEKAFSQIRQLDGIDIEAFTFTAKLRSGRILTGMGGEQAILANCAMQNIAILLKQLIGGDINGGEQDDN